ncbi:MAG: endo alpha-1,4 polygalactosaminidase [Rhodobacteraceae bacterium]|nr:endo alpha-1,4 polygalactosaminidase [Paracoccaceae bacterium]
MSVAALLALQLFVYGGEAPAYWDWQHTEPYDLSVQVEVLALDPDAFEPADIAGLRARGIKPVCYISVGTWEPWREDAAAFPAAVKGRGLPDWPDEVFLDIRAPEVLARMQARIDDCAALGFAAIEPDNLDSYEAETGFGLTEADALAYARALAGHAHALGLEIAQKNAPDLVPALVDSFDFALVEQCFEYDFCDAFAPYRAAGKDVLAVEYGSAGQDWNAICGRAKAAGIHLILKDEIITAGGRACR